MDIFDIVGPIMVGPSSSHTAGAVRIGYVAGKLLEEPIKKAEILLYGSFLATGEGHGTRKAIVAGLLGMHPDDYKISRSFEIAKEKNIEIEYIGGTSSGSIVSSLYAAGFTAEEIYNIFKKYCKKIRYADLKNILKLIYGLIIEQKIIIDGLSSGKEIEKLINKLVGSAS